MKTNTQLNIHWKRKPNMHFWFLLRLFHKFTEYFNTICYYYYYIFLFTKTTTTPDNTHHKNNK